MRKRLLAGLLVLLCVFGVNTASANNVFRAVEAEPFAVGEATFDLYVVPILGADCMVLVCGGETMLVDMGKASNYSEIKAVLDMLAIMHIDIAYNTHPHDDHLGAMKQIAADRTIGKFLTAFPEEYSGDSIIQTSTVRALREADIPVEHVEDGDTFMLGDARCEVIRQTRYAKVNPMSAMLKITFGERTILLTADVTGSAQTFLAETHDLDADIFKVPHHALNQVSAEFLAAISPEYAFITHGYANTKQAQAQLNKNQIPHDFATWGLIHLSTNGEYWLVDQQLNENGIRYNEKYR